MSKISGTFTTFMCLLLLASTQAQAALVQVSYAIDKDSNDPFQLGADRKTNNDCSGYFTAGNGFDSCLIAFADKELSPVIIKFNGDLELGEGAGEDDDGQISSLFPSVTGDEWEFSVPESATANNKGTWTYKPGENDPDVRYWAAKSGPGFILNWFVEERFAASYCYGIENTFACLNAAMPVLSGDWLTPGDKDLSHLTFYDSAPSLVPVPAAIWLFGTALIGFIGVSRKIRV